MTLARAELESEVRDIGARLYRDAGRHQPALFDSGGLRGRVLRQVLRDPSLRNALFQFIDVLPQLERADDVAAHFHSYLAGHELGGVWGKLLGVGNHAWAAWAVRNSVKRMARLFLVEEHPAALLRVLRTLQRVPAQVTVDAVGEAVLTDAEADHYLARYLELSRWGAAAGIAPHLSLKLTGLTPRFDPLDAGGTRQRVLRRLRPLLAEVRRTHAALTIDMEQYELKPLILELFRALVEDDADRNWLPGIALQAYLPETERDLNELIRWARALDRRISVRLVKGAYWDTEAALAQQRRWPVPVYRDKASTDANYEHLTRLLFGQRDIVYPAIGGHNLRSVSHAIALARDHGMTADDWEVQMLYGMADPLQRAVAGLGVKLRVYLPCGDLVVGIAYLIRRLLENTASTSILRQTYAEAQDPDTLLAAPKAAATADCVTSEPPVFANTPLTDFSRAEARSGFAHALIRVREQLGRDYPLAIQGASMPGTAQNNAINPARPDEVLGRVELASQPHARQAVGNALAMFPVWRDTPAAQRSTLCLRAAGLMLERRAELAVWEILEQGKSWREADADVAEAIDFLRYYAAQMMQLDGWRPTLCFAGETNHWRYEPRGVAVIIAPWNFPLAILAGMTAAALVTGNCAIMKPALPAQIVSWHFMEVLRAAGFPPGVCQLLPGRGDAIGDFLVEHPQVDVIAFTGSREVGLAILEKSARLAAGQTHVKRMVCEMGGKNAIIVDADADLDEAVAQILQSAFGYQGQKCSACSRVIAVGAVHDRLLARLAAALAAFSYGPPEDAQYVFGPVITRAAQQKALAYLDIGKREGQLYYQGQVPADGFYVPPTIFTDIEPRHRLAREEIFAPILAVLRAASFERALEIALDSDYALTGGVFSRLPQHLALARERFRVGNLYLNRRITGALVGAQPFGGVKLSGTGIQAGGADYLKQFLWTRVVSENTMRHGLVP
ncbi:MAG: bifunctional proline dehydrogenase/L-glutamate gamma-semialdehyde dehydrogenase [Betaproteobacteria bacterium]|nr:bifunctional proline dehydrogenase/L-glutamate gamma-semialdehyde dehydrogenase [Betaproteobacteria bacterium]